jgi:hypothetical protein
MDIRFLLPAVVVGLLTGAEPKKPTAEEIEKQFAAAEKYLTMVDTTGERMMGVSAAHEAAMNVKHLPEDSALRLKIVALARKFAAIPDYATVEDLRKQKRPENVDDHQAHARLYFAWHVLMETNVLRSGLRLEEYVALLGPPTKIGAETVEWYYSSGMHVNPCLRLWKQDGRTKMKLDLTRY